MDRSCRGILRIEAMSLVKALSSRYFPATKEFYRYRQGVSIYHIEEDWPNGISRMFYHAATLRITFTYANTAQSRDYD